MKDRDFLLWLHDRLVNVHGDHELADFMHKLRAVIWNTPSDRETPNSSPFNSSKEVREALKALAR